MAKGSQLSQLKSTLSQANSGKKRKRGLTETSNKAESTSPFDFKVTKLKHDVAGRKVKGRLGKPALKNQAGIEQRKKTLLVEVGKRNKAGGIVDRRFGENDPTMSIEERMLERFTRERQRNSRNSIFNLEDDTELTHYGQSLANLDDFDAIPLESDEDSDENETRRGQLDANVVREQHFGGFEDEQVSNEPPKKKSKAEVMSEVIAKSKEHKLLRQMENEREEQIRYELDADFKSVQDLLLRRNPDDAPPSTTAAPKDSQLSYDQIVHELAYEIRSKPKDRTKTEEEIALEKKEELEQAERRRLRRMEGEDDFDSDIEASSRRKRKNKEQQQDSASEESESEHQWPGLGGGLDEEDGLGQGNEDDSSSAIGEEDATDVDETEEDESIELSTGEGHNTTEALPTTSRPSSHGELPFTFPCPSSHDEWLDIIENIQPEAIATVIQRILTLYHPSLGSENADRLQDFLKVLIDHLLFAAAPPDPQFSLVDDMLPFIVKLSRMYPTSSANAFKSKLHLMESNLQRGIAAGPKKIASKTFPGASELTLLRVIGNIWSTSDMKHSVAGPAQLLMGAYLELGRIRSLRDVASGLFLVTLFYQYESFSKRFVPEAINFLLNAVLFIGPSNLSSKDELPECVFAPDQWGSMHTHIQLQQPNNLVPQSPHLSACLSEDASDLEQMKVDLLAVALNLLKKFGDMYQSLDGFVDLFGAVLEVVKSLGLQSYSTKLRQTKSECEDTITKMLKLRRLGRRPLVLQSHKPVPIATYAPKFTETSSSYLRVHDPDKERAAASKLRREYKQERKGALRELRKDARFLARHQQERQREKDEAYNLSMRRVVGSIEGERAEEKKMLKEKMKERKRAGRK